MRNLALINRPPPTEPPSPQALATAFMARHQAEHLRVDEIRLVQRCISYLTDEHKISTVEAWRAATQAHGHISAADCPAHIDIDHTTSYCVLVNIGGHGTAAFPLHQLVELALRHPEEVLIWRS